jgi:hypothetical protein
VVPVTIEEIRKPAEGYRPILSICRGDALDDIPFIVEGSKESPARRGRPQLNSQVKPWKRGYCRETHINIPFMVCQRFTVAAVEKNASR